MDKLTSFLRDLNAFHTNLYFTHELSHSSINFLDLTIYNRSTFTCTNILETKTFQKECNLYQYLHFASNHLQHVYKGNIKGECIRYVRTNTSYEDYAVMVYIYIQTDSLPKLTDRKNCGNTTTGQTTSATDNTPVHPHSTNATI